MKDKEIIKALECGSQENGCYECPYEFACYDDEYKSILSKDTLDLINRQQAEIEKLQKENKFFRKTIQENAQRALEVTIEEVENAKTEAIKEFAERLKEKADRGFFQEHSYVDVEDIDDTLKEMVGDAE